MQLLLTTSFKAKIYVIAHKQENQNIFEEPPLNAADHKHTQPKCSLRLEAACRIKCVSINSD